jgi:hypothetical protein
MYPCDKRILRQEKPPCGDVRSLTDKRIDDREIARVSVNVYVCITTVSSDLSGTELSVWIE